MIFAVANSILRIKNRRKKNKRFNEQYMMGRFVLELFSQFEGSIKECED